MRTCHGPAIHCRIYLSSTKPPTCSFSFFFRCFALSTHWPMQWKKRTKMIVIGNWLTYGHAISRNQIGLIVSLPAAVGHYMLVFLPERKITAGNCVCERAAMLAKCACESGEPQTWKIIRFGSTIKASIPLNMGIKWPFNESIAYFVGEWSVCLCVCPRDGRENASKFQFTSFEFIGGILPQYTSAHGSWLPGLHHRSNPLPKSNIWFLFGERTMNE